MKLKIHYQVRWSQILIPVMSHINPIYNNMLYLFKIHFKIIHYLEQAK
jgi:hypothetical protein